MVKGERSSEEKRIVRSQIFRRAFYRFGAGLSVPDIMFLNVEIRFTR